MKPHKAKAPYFHIIFAEDVRYEATGKATIIGWHQDSKVIKPKDAPLLIPKLCLIYILALPCNPSPKKIINRIKFNGEDFAVNDVSEILGASLPENTNADVYAEMSFTVTLLNRKFDSEGELSVTVDLDDDSIHSNSLSIVEE